VTLGLKRENSRQDAKMNENVIGEEVVGGAVKVYREFGAGLLEWGAKPWRLGGFAWHLG
jgi:hypothetical protein